MFRRNQISLRSSSFMSSFYSGETKSVFVPVRLSFLRRSSVLRCSSPSSFVRRQFTVRAPFYSPFVRRSTRRSTNMASDDDYSSESDAPFHPEKEPDQGEDSDRAAVAEDVWMERFELEADRNALLGIELEYKEMEAKGEFIPVRNRDALFMALGEKPDHSGRCYGFGAVNVGYSKAFGHVPHTHYRRSSKEQEEALIRKMSERWREDISTYMQNVMISQSPTHPPSGPYPSPCAGPSPSHPTQPPIPSHPSPFVVPSPTQPTQPPIPSFVPPSTSPFVGPSPRPSPGPYLEPSPGPYGHLLGHILRHLLGHLLGHLLR
ncbi:hypothetical protein BVRB_003690 [Beta vulgaris subsp. vulgaris]|uniref:Uncharacterized protein n=1 Tax=Beta vulgaris subsp. vulgaris TaxID=3555 RepID=A0A0J8B7J2_BETVV|nr:hypothetical protein BVRB_003690 [Beta vulgaris subsp. vulgaris]